MTTNLHTLFDEIDIKASRRRRLTRRLGRRLGDVGKPVIDRDNDGKCFEESDGSFIPCPPGVRAGSKIRSAKPTRTAQRKPSTNTPISTKAIQARQKALPQPGESTDDVLKRFLPESVIDEVPGTTVPKKQTAVIDELGFLFGDDDIEQARSSTYPSYEAWKAWYDQGNAEMQQFLGLFFDDKQKQQILDNPSRSPFNIKLNKRTTDDNVEILDANGNTAVKVKKSSFSAGYADVPNHMAVMMMESGLTLPDYVRDALGIERSNRYGMSEFPFERSDFEFEDTPAGRYYSKIVDRLFSFHEAYDKWAKDVATKWPGTEHKDKWLPGSGFAQADDDTEKTVTTAIKNLLNPNFTNSADSENQRTETLHELGHIALGQGVGRHGDHTANLAIMSLLGTEAGRIAFNLITAIQWGQFHGKDNVDPQLWKDISIPMFPIWGDMDPRLVGWWK